MERGMERERGRETGRQGEGLLTTALESRPQHKGTKNKKAMYCRESEQAKSKQGWQGIAIPLLASVLSETMLKLVRTFWGVDEAADPTKW